MRFLLFSFLLSLPALVFFLDYKNLFLTLSVILYTFAIYITIIKILLPIEKMKKIIDSFYLTGKLDEIIKPSGFSFIKDLHSKFNRIMLELYTFRSFHLDNLVDERNKLDFLMENLSDMVMLLDTSGKIIHCNKPLLTFFNLDPNNFGRVEDISGADEFKKCFREILSCTETESKREISYMRNNYIILFRKFSISSLKIEAVMFMIRDITNEKKIERLKDDFLHMITHDLRNPVSVLKGYCDILKNKVGDDRFKSTFDIMDEVLEKISGMIDDILNIAKLENGNFVPVFSKINSKEFIEKILKTQSNFAMQRKIKIDFESKDSFIFEADRRLIERVLVNLIGNAIKFTHSNGKILIKSEKNEEYALFSVSDTGNGIPEDKKSIIFEKFVQVDDHRNMGFGIGLAMCKMAVEIHKGTIWVESQVGKGSSFNFKLPLKQT